MSRPKTRRTITAAAIAVTAFAVAAIGIGAGVISAGAAGATTTTYYACLKGGTLSNVGRTAPTCKSPATLISWNQTGPAGPAGNTVLSGTGKPPSTIGTQGDFYLQTSNHTIYGPATHTCSPLPCHTNWGTGTSLIGPAGPAGQGPAYQTTGTQTVNTDNGSAVITSLTLPDGYFTLNATVGTTSSLGPTGLYCQLSVNYDNGLDGAIDTEYDTVPGEITLSGSVYYSPQFGTGYALVYCYPGISENNPYTAPVTAHLTATQVSNVINQ